MIKNIFFRPRIYYLTITIAMIFIVGYFYPLFYILGKYFLICLAAITIIDFIFLFSIRSGIAAQRITSERLSNGDSNDIKIAIRSQYSLRIEMIVIDEIPFQFQIRDFKIAISLDPAVEKEIVYKLRPVERGIYSFGLINIYAFTFLGLLSRRYKCGKPSDVTVYPSFIQMRKYEFLAISNKMEEAGIKKIRQKGTPAEFDQVREYVEGDDYRIMNWKATARRGALMVNQYQDEKSKEVYCIIDKGRTMKMPFDKLELVDYAINSSLVLSNIALLKQDKAGLLTYNTQIDNFLQASRKAGQLNKIMEILYNQRSDFRESNTELLYLTLKQKVRQRSLLILFTNFESIVSLRRHLKAFSELSKHHLLLVIIFENTEIKKIISERTNSLEDVYKQVIAQKFISDKKLIVKELNQHGIHSILTPPQNLTVNLINKYLEFKSLGML